MHPFEKLIKINTGIPVIKIVLEIHYLIQSSFKREDASLETPMVANY